MVAAPATFHATDVERDSAFLGELEGVGEEIEDDLLKPLLVGPDRVRQLAVELDLEVEPLVGSQLAEGPLHMLLEGAQRHVTELDRHRPRFDLRKIEDVVDQAQKIRSRAVDSTREFGLLGVEIALRIVGQQFGKDEQRVERGPELVRHVGEEFGLVFRSQGKLLGFLLDRSPSHVDLDILRFDLLLLVLEQLRLFLQLLVRVVEFLLLGGELSLTGLKLLGEQLRLLQEPLGAHGRSDRVENDPDRLHQLVEETLVGLVELAEGGELDHRLDIVLEQSRHDDDVRGRRMTEAGADPDEFARYVFEQHRPLVGGALPNQALAQPEHRLQGVEIVGAVAGGELDHRILFLPLGDVEDAILGVHQRGELRHDQVRHGGEIAFALKHPRETGEVGLQPVLLRVLQRLILQVADHLVDIVLERRHLTGRFHRDRPGEIALRHRGRHIRNRSNLIG